MSTAERIVVIGGVAAGPKAAAKARRCNPRARITMVEKGRHVSYGGCGMPYLISGEVESADELMATPMGTLRTPEFFKKGKNIDVLIRHEATRIDRDAKQVEVKNLETGKTTALDYDKLVLAVGSTATKPDLPGADLKNVLGLACMEDAQTLVAALNSGKIKRAVCCGGGLVTLETVHGLVKRGVETAVVCRSDQILFRLDYEMGACARRELEKGGVAVYTGETLKAFIGKDGTVCAVETDKRRIEADMVLYAKGVKPNTKLAKEAGLAIGESGAIQVDECLRTSDPDIYAAGDCAETTHLVTGKHSYNPRGSTANKMGRVVGVNATGGSDTFPGVLGNLVLRVLNLQIGKVGLTEKEARAEGYDIETVIVPGFDKAHFYPDADRVILKLVADRKTGKLLGMQGAGHGEVVKRIDVATAMLTLGSDVYTLANLDLGYAPPFGSAMDPIITAANVMKNKLEGRAVGISPVEVKKKLDDGGDFVFLDVRNDDEYEEEHIPGTTLIPLGKLKERMGELPKDKEIIGFCAISLRAYAACLTLKANGFENVKFMDGGMAAWPYEREAKEG